MTRRSVCTGLLAVVGWGSLSVTTRSLEPIELRLTALEDSSSYLVYRYEAVSPSTATQGVAALLLDVSASAGTPSSTLPATGYFLNGPAITPLAVTPHAEVGPISPTNWGSALRRTAILTWGGANGDIYDNDSIAPGDTLTGLGIRSSFLPGIRQVGAVPTWQSCCTESWGTEEENPTRQHRNPDYFAVYSTTVAPRYAPDEVTLDVLRSQRAAVCSDPLWIDDAPVCAELADSLAAADARLASGDNAGAGTALEGVLAILDAEREPTGPIENNAYWLLRLNTDHVLGTIPGAGDVATGSATGGVTPNGTVTSVVTSTQLNGGDGAQRQKPTPSPRPTRTKGQSSAKQATDQGLPADNVHDGRPPTAGPALVGCTPKTRKPPGPEVLGALSKKPATTYSPTGRPRQYHPRCGA